MIGLATLPERFKQANVPSWVEYVEEVGSREEQRQAQKIGSVLTSYLADVDEHYSNARGLLLLGPPGRGKSYLACAVLRAAPAKYQVRYATLAGIVRLTQRSFSLQKSWEKGVDDTYDDWRKVQRMINKLRNKVDFLMVDDVGKEYRTDSGYAESEFDYMLRHRYDRGLPTLLTSNVPLEKWVQTYSASMHSFIHETSFLISLEGLPDLRRDL